MNYLSRLSCLIMQLGNQIRNHPEFVFLFALLVLSRLLPHPENFTPIAAMGLFCGAYLSNRLFMLLPVAAALVADLSSTGFYDLVIMALVYLGLFSSSLVGRWFLYQRRTLPRLPIAVIVSALAFYLISNFGSWLVHYPRTLQGFISCYSNGLPYLLRSLAGDIFYAALIFISYEVFLRNLRRGHFVSESPASP